MASKRLAAILPSVAQLKTFLFAACVMIGGTASAATTGYVSNPTGNSVDWANAVISRGATVNTHVNFNGITGSGTVTPAIGGFYTATDGVSFSAANMTLQASMSPGGFTFNGEGEGVWTPSKLLVASSASLSSTPAQSVTFTFTNPVFGGGAFLVDLCGACQAWTISARDANNNVLGSFQSLAGAGFQQTNANPGVTHKYFVGISSTEANIASVTISRPAMSMFVSGDTVGLDDFRFAAAAVPEPAEWAMLLAGLLVIGCVAARRNHFAD